MTNTEQNIINLYETLISDGYFRDDNGEINLSVEQFGTNLRNAKIAKAFYANLLQVKHLFSSPKSQVNLH